MANVTRLSAEGSLTGIKVLGEAYPQLILYDGVCNLCNGIVKFVLKHDHQGKFRFAALQDVMPDSDYDTFVYVRYGEVLAKSSAAFMVVRDLNGGWGVLGRIGLVFPRRIRDAAYSFVARNRYQWFGKRDSCPMPEPEWKERFILPPGIE